MVLIVDYTSHHFCQQVTVFSHMVIAMTVTIRLNSGYCGMGLEKREFCVNT